MDSLRVWFNHCFTSIQAEFEGREYLLSLGFTLKADAVMKFLLDGKRIKVIGARGIETNCSEIDKEFLEAISKIPAKKWSIWKKVLQRLVWGESRKQILEYLTIEALSNCLS